MWLYRAPYVIIWKDLNSLMLLDISNMCPPQIHTSAYRLRNFSCNVELKSWEEATWQQLFKLTNYSYFWNGFFKLMKNKTCIKDCKNKNLSLLLQGLRQLAGCVANTAAVPLMRTLAWVWHSPSPMNQDTSKGFQSTFSLIQPCSTMKWKMYQNLF